MPTLRRGRLRIAALLAAALAAAFAAWNAGRICDKLLELRCGWPNLYHDVPGGNLDPAIEVRWTIDDYRRGVDTVLRRAQE